MSGRPIIQSTVAQDCVTSLTIVPPDESIPQDTEGVEIITLSITPVKETWAMRGGVVLD